MNRVRRRAGNRVVVDILTLALTHGLMAVALLRLLSRDDLDREPPPGA